jgi:antitoxin VapB
MVEWYTYEVEYLQMSMNIKNKEAHKLARQLARVSGESMTEAVTEAVRERLKRLQDNDKQAAKLSDRLLEIGRDCAPRLKEPFRSAEHGDLLYDENGLPQ